MRAYTKEELMALSTGTLEGLLKEALDKRPLDRDYILTISGIMEAREADMPVPEDACIQQAWDKYRQAVDQTERQAAPTPPRRWLVGLAAAAAMLCFFVFAVPAAVGAENIGDLLSRWGNEIFEFFNPGSTPSDTQYGEGSITEHPGLQQVYDAAVEIGIEEPKVPTWLPEGFVLTELKKSMFEGKRLISAVMKNGENYIQLVIGDAGTSSARYPTDAEETRDRDVANLRVTLFRNQDKWTAVYDSNGIEYYFTANIEEAVFYDIVDSICEE